MYGGNPKNILFYPEEFATRVKAVCADGDPTIKGFVEECLENGSIDLGALLKYGFSTSFSYSDILEAESLNELRAKAEEMKEVYELSQEWKRLYEQQKKQAQFKDSN